jgi:hypothetical protein
MTALRTAIMNLCVHRCACAIQEWKYGASDVRRAGETFTWFARVLCVVSISGESEGVDAEGLGRGVFSPDMRLLMAWHAVTRLVSITA